MSGSNAGAPGKTYLIRWKQAIAGKTSFGYFSLEFSCKTNQPIIQQPCDWLVVFTTKVSSSSTAAWDYKLNTEQIGLLLKH